MKDLHKLHPALYVIGILFAMIIFSERDSCAMNSSEEPGALKLEAILPDELELEGRSSGKITGRGREKVNSGKKRRGVRTLILDLEGGYN